MKLTIDLTPAAHARLVAYAAEQSPGDREPLGHAISVLILTRSQLHHERIAEARAARARAARRACGGR